MRPLTIFFFINKYSFWKEEIEAEQSENIFFSPSKKEFIIIYLLFFLEKNKIRRLIFMQPYISLDFKIFFDIKNKSGVLWESFE